MRTKGGQEARDFPWWLVATGLIGLLAAWQIAVSPIYAEIMATLSRGLWITVFVSIVSFALAALLGLILALALSSSFITIRQAARFYIEIVRGIPIIVLLLYIAFVGGPGLVWLCNQIIEPLGFEPWRTRDLSLMWRAIIALMIGYSPYIAEVFRAGFEAVQKGQLEAATALGLSKLDRFRFITLPQALRIMAPALGNFFIAMVKDSALVSVLGVSDITQLGKVTSAGNFRYLETYNVVTFLYLILTIGLSLALRQVEKRLKGWRE